MKNFLKNLLLFAIAFGIACFIYPQYSMGRTLKFAQLSDLHTSHKKSNSGNRMHTSSFELAKDAIEQVNAMPDLDFVVFTGDGVDLPAPDLLNEFGELIGTLNKPYYYALGNHDTSVDFKKEKSIKILAKHNPYKTFKKPYYSTTVNKNFKIIVLDGTINSEVTVAGNIDEKQLKWLDEELKESQNKVVLIFCHFPIEEPFSSYHHKIRNEAQVKAILNKYKMPIAVFTGHYHVARIIQKDNIIYASCPSLIMYPNAFRVVSIKNFDDRAEFKFELKETNLKQIQKTSKLLTLSAGLAYGVKTDRENTIVIKKEQTNVQK